MEMSSDFTPSQFTIEATMTVKVEITGIENAISTAANVLRQIPFATANAMTRTAKEAVDAGRKEVAAHFVVRKSWISGRVKILQYPRASGLTVVVGIDSRVQGAPLLLGFFEEGQGGTKDPAHGSGLAIPLTAGPARPDFASPVLTAFRYLNLRLNQGKGRKGTFIVPGIGVFERLGPGGRVWSKSRKKMVTVDPSETSLVYMFRPRAPLKTRMQLKQVMERKWAERFPEIFAEEFEREVMKRAEHIGAKLK
jgi:hypothetical protein